MSDDMKLTAPEYLRTIPRTKPVPELILDEIARLITEGILKPGDRLPSESELAERFGVGRSSLREAMRALQLLGIVEVIQGKGTFLRQTHMLPLATDWARLSRMGLISQVMEARQIIEVAIAQLAAERATEEDIAVMRAAIRRAEEAHGDSVISGEASVDFHLALAEATHNKVLALMYKTVRDLYLETARQTQTTPESMENRLQDHRQILESVEQQNPELASKLMAEHIEKGRRFLAAC
jgi:GntR family transcriptional repressor for pyruvate dehydrogenase complex